MNDDFSDVINKFSNILKEKNIDLNSIVSMATEDSPSSANDCTDENSNDFSFDIDTILKIKDILSKINSNQNSSRNHLLHALKPYLKNDKQEKLEKYIKIASLLSVLENMDSSFSFFNDNKKGYDFILIITLVLLIF